jgi:hypothetical protein
MFEAMRCVVPSSSSSSTIVTPGSALFGKFNNELGAHKSPPIEVANHLVSILFYVAYE